MILKKKAEAEAKAKAKAETISCTSSIALLSKNVTLGVD